MMSRILLFLSLLLTSTTTFAVNQPDALWQMGNTCYQRKAYDSAVQFYEQIATQKPRNADVYFNLGNAYYRLNKIAPAVLNYERALKIDPGFTDARENLQLTQNRIRNHIQEVGDIFFVSWWNSLTHPSKSGAWAVTALIIFLLIIATLAVRRYLNLPGIHIPVQIAWVLGFCWICFISIAIASASRTCSKSAGVIMQNDTPLLTSILQGKSITQIPEGTTIAIIDEKDNWLEVRIPDGRVGWIQQSLIEKI